MGENASLRSARRSERHVMTTIEQAIGLLHFTVDRTTVETYVARTWVRPTPGTEGWQFAEIDIARIDLVTHLRRDMQVNDEAMDVVLSLLDQLHDLRARIRGVRAAVEARPESKTDPLKALLHGL